MKRRRLCFFTLSLLSLPLILSMSVGCANVLDDAAKGDFEPGSTAAALDGWTLIELDTPVVSPSPYPNNLAESWTVSAPPNADRFQIHFRYLDVERHYDAVRIFNAEGTLLQTLDGEFTGWSETIQGTEARVELITDYSVRRAGFHVDAVQYQVDDEPPLGSWERIQLSRTDQISTPHPYPNHFRDKWTLTGPEGTTRIRVLFDGFETERGYDRVYLYDGNGRQVATYEGLLGDFTSIEVAGNAVTVELVSDYSITEFGFDIFYYEVYREQTEPGCTTDADCPEGQRCQQVWCVRAPCPWMCVPAEEASGPTELCNRSIPCEGGLECTNMFWWGSMACAEPAWSTVEVTGGPISTPHPYTNDFEQCWSIEGPDWGDSMIVNFENFDTERSYDFVTVKGLVGDQIERFHGELGNFESSQMIGVSAEVCLQTDYSVTRYGFDIADYQVEGVPFELAPMAYEEMGCGYGHATDEDSIRALFDAEGVTLYGYDYRHISDIHCLACPCPTGEAAVVLIRPEDIPVAVHLNFFPFRPIENELIEIEDPTVLEVQPRQCLSNPWDQWWLENHEGDPPPESTRIVEWAEAVHGVTVHAVWSVETLQMVCLACSCPRGDLLYWLVSGPDADILREAGIPL